MGLSYHLARLGRSRALACDGGIGRTQIHAWFDRRIHRCGGRSNDGIALRVLPERGTFQLAVGRQGLGRKARDAPGQLAGMRHDNSRGAQP